ncbi:antibiotic biosynthesis monooxygenase [Kribbella amoyensis]|uniref:Antibiotic biosynthesis monooxygenase n=1 Tax=Kribbella amoyensis TaxID=996641 RepID=A0A561BZA1_9ACTN|nr:antibiotic biosynthesis monooxygenase [Kribbella amoyensis]TWD84191.1 antibiotic biosynthesis monooxygenase [Kribbella amoyensis]
MIVIAGYHLVDADARDQYVTAFSKMVARARESDGCVHFAITADSVDPGQVNSLEIWQDAETLAQWRKRARAGRTARPRHSVVRHYTTTDGGQLL